MDEKAEIAAETTETGHTRPKRKRTGRKRTSFKVPPKMARPVRALWDEATQADRERAHATCVLMLEYWLGKKSKGQVAEELAVAPLRVWQLSQQALSGMLAGLLVQPRARRGRPPASEVMPDGTDPVALKKRVLELEKALARTEDLVRVLRTAPWGRPPAESAPKGGPRHARKRRRTTKAAQPGRSQATRSAAPGSRAQSGGASNAG